jgi:putative hemolysin
MIETYELVALCICFLGSAFYSGSEAVLMSIGVDRTKQLIEEGGSKAAALEFMLNNPSSLLTTILVGNNVTNILAASLTTSIATRIFEHDAVGISVGITTFIILIFGEIIPKTFARTHNETLAYPVIRILQLNYYITWPIIKMMTILIHRILGKNAQLAGRIITQDDIEYMVNKAEKEKTIDSKQLELLSSILEFPTIKVKDIMIPRNKVVYVQSDWSYGEVIERLSNDNHSRYPVCKDDLDHTIGFLHVKALAFVDAAEQEEFELKNILKSPFYVYEHMKIQAVFDHMKRKKVHLALVKDENGLVVGIVTLEDIIEEIMGEIEDEYDLVDHSAEMKIKQEDLKAGVTLSGSILIRDLYNEYDIHIPLNDNYSTLNGFLLDMLGNNFPEKNQIIFWEGYSFKVVKVSDSEIKKVLVSDVGGEKHLFSKKEAGEGGPENH